MTPSSSYLDCANAAEVRARRNARDTAEKSLTMRAYMNFSSWFAARAQARRHRSGSGSNRTSGGGPAALDRQHRAGDRGCMAGAQELDEPGNLLHSHELLRRLRREQ